MKRKKIQLLLLQNVVIMFFVTCCFLLLTAKTFAAATPEQSISVSPIINDLQLIPGKKTTFPVTIRNNNTTSIGIHIETTGYDITDATSLFQERQSVMTGWTTLSQSDLLIDGKQTKTIVVTIKSPTNIKQNGYYETIFLTPIFHQQQTTTSPIILSRFGVLVLGTVGKLNYNDLVRKVLVTDIAPAFTILNSLPDKISFTVANNYFTHFDAKPFITITPLFANSQTTMLTDKHVLPGSARVWQYQMKSQPNHFLYFIHLAISIGDGKQIYADTFFIVLPYKKILLLLFILILFYIGIFRRDRITNAVRILIKGK